jgi:hypothetical protein
VLHNRSNNPRTEEIKVARIVVRNQFVDVPDQMATVLAGLGAESYLRIEEMWKADQRREYEQVARQQNPAPQAATRARQPAPQPDEKALRHAAVAEMAKARGQTSW